MSRDETLSGVALTLRLPGDLHSKLRELAWQHRTSMNHEVTVAVRAHLDSNKSRRSR